MLRRIVRFSLRFPGVVVGLAFAALGYGLYTATEVKLDVFPEFAPPMVAVQTEAPGFSPEQVEALVTRPLETALNGLPRLTAIRSQSIQGLSVIRLIFEERADPLQARQLTGERLLAAAGELPAGVKAPQMGPLVSSTSLALSIGLTSADRTPMELRAFADWTLRPRLLGTPGVGSVEVFGGEERQFQIQVHSERLAQFGLSLQDVLDAARRATGIRGAGFVENANQRILIRPKGQALTPAELGETTITRRLGTNVRLRDVADVVEGPEPKFGDAQINGRSGVILLVKAQYGANTLEVTANVEAALAEMAPVFAAEKIQLHPRLFRPATFIQTALRNIRRSLVLGGAFVAVVLFLFLMDWRTALISFLTIPVSLLAAVIVLNAFGASLNTLTLGGFAIAIGVVVDDAIIDVENILRRLRENKGRPSPLPARRVVLDASLEVRSAVVYATFIVALVFAPVLMMGGVEGRMFAPLALAFLLATLASLLAALTLTPALCLLWLRREAGEGPPGWVRGLQRLHRALLARAVRLPWLWAALAAAATLGAVWLARGFGGEFLPEFQEGHFVLHMAAVPGTSLAESIRIGKLVARKLLQDPRIRAVSQQAGRAERGEDAFGPHMSELHVDLAPEAADQAQKVKEDLRRELARFPGVSFRILSFLAERMEEVLSGAKAQVAVVIFGPELRAGSAGRTRPPPCRERAGSGGRPGGNQLRRARAGNPASAGSAGGLRPAAGRGVGGPPGGLPRRGGKPSGPRRAGRPGDGGPGA